MGIKRLHTYFNEYLSEQPITAFEGQKFGIDANGFINQIFYSVLNDNPNINLPLIRNIELKISLLVNAGVGFVFVFDGKKLEAKEYAINSRETKRDSYKRKSETCKFTRQFK